MSTQDKYFFGKVEDARAALDANEQHLLLSLLQKIHTWRTRGGKRTNRYFVLNVADPAARAAMDAYVAAGESILQNSENGGLRAAVAKAREVLFASKLNDPEKLPD